MATEVESLSQSASSRPAGKATGNTASRGSWGRLTFLGLLLSLVLGYVGFRSLQAASDGPLNDIIPGGRLVSGAWATPDPSLLETDHRSTVELQLENPARSRFVGVIGYQGALYIPLRSGLYVGAV